MSARQGLGRKAHFVGTKIRSLRKRNNLTLEDLSVRCVQVDAEAAPSVSYLSMIENGKRTPSIEVLELPDVDRPVVSIRVDFPGASPETMDAEVISLLEGVEDIPGTALHAGIQWRWESFPEYLDALERTPLAIDVGTQVPHGAVRAFVMGERGVAHEVAAPEDDPPEAVSAERFMQLMAVDKKVLDGGLRLVLLKGIGDAVVTGEFDPDLLSQTLARAA